MPVHRETRSPAPPQAAAARRSDGARSRGRPRRHHRRICDARSGPANYGVVIRGIDPELDRFEIDVEATEALRTEIRTLRPGWLSDDAETVAARYRSGELPMLDVIRRHGVILDWGTGELYPTTTAQYRELMQRRSAAHWQ